MRACDTARGHEPPEGEVEAMCARRIHGTHQVLEFMALSGQACEPESALLGVLLGILKRFSPILGDFPEDPRGAAAQVIDPSTCWGSRRGWHGLCSRGRMASNPWRGVCAFCA